jgi:hypothetical protein
VAAPRTSPSTCSPSLLQQEQKHSFSGNPNRNRRRSKPAGGLGTHLSWYAEAGAHAPMRKGKNSQIQEGG